MSVMELKAFKRQRPLRSRSKHRQSPRRQGAARRRAAVRTEDKISNRSTDGRTRLFEHHEPARPRFGQIRGRPKLTRQKACQE